MGVKHIWILIPALLAMLEIVQPEIGKCNTPKTQQIPCTSGSYPHLTPPSIKAQIAIHKVSF